MFFPTTDLPFAAVSSAGETFRTVLPFGLLAGIALVVIHLIVTQFGRKAASPRIPWRWWESLVYLGAVAIIGYLGLTSFVAVWRLGAIGGWWLFAHMCGAGAMVAVLPLLAVMWADANRFQLAPSGDGETNPPSGFLALTKIAFWTILVSGLIVTGTMIVSMLTWLGTEGQHLMLNLHRWAGLVCVVAAGIHVYGVVLARRKAPQHR